jgi:small-conductance mechanosensitive channel
MNILPYLIKPKVWFVKTLIIGIIILISVLGYFGYLKSTIELLDSEKLSLSLGSIDISLYQILKRLTFLILLLSFINLVLDRGVKYFRKTRKIKPSNKPLIIKIYQIIICVIAFIFGLNILNIKLTSLAIFGGAIGIGLGFGLQKITSNFISGLILLFEKSIEEGDLVELENGVYGFIKNTGARYTLVETFDSKEIMIPNEEFITKNVINWTYSNKQGRIDIEVGVSYKSDIEKARELILEAAREHKMCSKDPAPNCFLREYADSSINFLLHFWIDDVTIGRFEPQSDVMRAIWKKFKENNIEIPFPQRDVHIINNDVDRSESNL